MNAVRRLGLAGIIPWVVPKKLLEMRRKNARFSEERVDRRLAGGNVRGDLWDGVLSGTSKSQPMSKPEIVSNASAIVVAGSETSATLLSGCTWLLLTHPDVHQRLVKHVREHFGKEEDIDLVSVGKLSYLLAVLDEAMRLYPPVRKSAKCEQQRPPCPYSTMLTRGQQQCRAIESLHLAELS